MEKKKEKQMGMTLNDKEKWICVCPRDLSPLGKLPKWDKSSL